MDYNLPGSSVHRIFWARILGWVAISLSRGLSQSWHQTRVPCISSIDRQILYNCTISDYVGLWLLPSLGNFQTVFIQILFHLYALFYFWSSENKEIRVFFFFFYCFTGSWGSVIWCLLCCLGWVICYCIVKFTTSFQNLLNSSLEPIQLVFISIIAFFSSKTS